jgi:hypothetical protein
MSCTSETNRGWWEAVKVKGPSNILTVEIAVDKTTTVVKVVCCDNRKTT